jgi:hypothetical protein
MYDLAEHCDREAINRTEDDGTPTDKECGVMNHVTFYHETPTWTEYIFSLLGWCDSGRDFAYNDPRNSYFDRFFEGQGSTVILPLLTISIGGRVFNFNFNFNFFFLTMCQG